MCHDRPSTGALTRFKATIAAGTRIPDLGRVDQGHHRRQGGSGRPRRGPAHPAVAWPCACLCRPRGLDLAQRLHQPVTAGVSSGVTTGVPGTDAAGVGVATGGGGTGCVGTTADDRGRDDESHDQQRSDGCQPDEPQGARATDPVAKDALGQVPILAELGDATRVPWRGSRLERASAPQRAATAPGSVRTRVEWSCDCLPRGGCAGVSVECCAHRGDGAVVASPGRSRRYAHGVGDLVERQACVVVQDDDRALVD